MTGAKPGSSALHCAGHATPSFHGAICVVTLIDLFRPGKERTDEH